MGFILLSYVTGGRGIFSRAADVEDGVWIRLRNAARDIDASSTITSTTIEVAWPNALTLLRTLAPLQRSLSFQFRSDVSSRERIAQFIRDVGTVKRSAGALTDELG